MTPDRTCCKQGKGWRGNPYFYIPKYLSSDALPAPEIFSIFLLLEFFFIMNAVCSQHQQYLAEASRKNGNSIILCRSRVQFRGGGGGGGKEKFLARIYFPYGSPPNRRKKGEEKTKNISSSSPQTQIWKRTLIRFRWWRKWFAYPLESESDLRKHYLHLRSHFLKTREVQRNFGKTFFFRFVFYEKLYGFDIKGAPRKSSLFGIVGSPFTPRRIILFPDPW